MLVLGPSGHRLVEVLIYIEVVNRDIYHCPYCNLCRVGKGLGIDYYHCMNCNACMSRTLLVHVCREKSFMDNCPICHEDIFTSSSPVKALPCGHLMHSACFQVFTSSNPQFLNLSNLVLHYLDKLTGVSYADSRTTPVLAIPAQSAASHLET